MTRTGARAAALRSLLAAAGWEPVAPPSVVRVADAPGAVQDRVFELFSLLGGVRDRFRSIRPGGYDLAFNHPRGGLVLVELDEEQHHTRYRLATLMHPSGEALPWTEAYHAFCIDDRHLIRGYSNRAFWTSAPSERMFGPSDSPGVFEACGAARWKQRAFYDATKDALPGRPLARVSVYDSVTEDVTVEKILRSGSRKYLSALVRLVESRFLDRAEDTTPLL